MVFVCTGNTCRSPMAELLFNKLLEENNVSGWEVISAGISSFPGQMISQNAAKVLREEGINSEEHSSKQLNEEILSEADLILTMTGNHKRRILSSFPEYTDRVFTLKEYAGNIVDGSDIIDPFGQSELIYRETRDEIRKCLESILGKLTQSKNFAGNFYKTENNNYRGDNMKIAIGSDHAAYELKNEIIKFLEEKGFEYKDMGTDSSQSVDYPDYGYKVAKLVADGECDKGILICGTGIGMSITANKVKGIRAALCHDTFSARATRNHNNSNVLTMGARVVGTGLALDIVRVWLGEEFDGGRHQNRIDKIAEIERGEFK
ncbi:MAG: ribose 5-phosphate isomerase B [Halanaerobiales bacterium]